MEKLTEQQVTDALKSLPEWRLDNKSISRRYRLASFAAAIRFVNSVAEEAERRNHHPFIAVEYKVVTLRLTSWHAGGLTQADIEEAQACDELFHALG